MTRPPSQNARRHGVLAAPDPEVVAQYLRRILELKPSDPLPEPGGERLAAAATLARREAELDRALAHYVECLGAEDDPEVDYMRDLLRDLIEDYDLARDTRSEAARRLLRLDLFEGWVLSGRRRLSARYLREAQGRRKRALKDFMAA